MENYSRARVVEQPCVSPFADLPDTPEVRVRDGSKIRNLLRFALSRLEAGPGRAQKEGEEAGSGPGPSPAPPCGRLLFSASGRAVSKAITCAEVVKRRLTGLHQLTRLSQSTVLEVWEPLEAGAGLDSLTVSRKLPAVWILLSREPLDPEQPGYQAPGRYDALWAPEGAGGPGAGLRRRRGGGGGRGKGSGRHTGRSREPGKGQ
ncbi:ribonuclease P protein subunit p25-like protein [Xiphophorus hellerii]|uniref:ribonuclease P protein subunit p25-like protein n=1 Tax=Xiphophorus hellerii TaxID=8084 RepID=UPI0013B45F34|nr:ribonuclease P protein subunit p25-like protein [Xiphophorus hellerii]XP_032413736.1 ribonuclease P protein subunit p25-like protein [Xiphophorus hellerii]XP_032413737.1 ribonuclease P protein subunit p25-like protein [Xiphophorus hellerii]XP_032413738.1 ribonuclease P protein subunit p25-like protein [Xiphophorus hellerii]